MQRLGWIVGLGLILAATWWLLSGRERAGDDTLVDTTQGAHAGRPTLHGQAPAAAPMSSGAPVAARARPGAITGKVWRGSRPAQARVEVRDLGGANLDTLSLTRPFFAAGPALAATLAAEDGTFLVVDLPLGNYQVRALAEDGAVGWARAFCHAGTPVAECHVRLVEGSEVIEARATYADGRPFRGQVSAMGGVGGGFDHLPEVETDAEGGFRIPGLPTGAFQLRFFVAGDFASWFTDLEAPMATGRVFVVDEGLTSLVGRVVADDSEAPISAASIVYDTGRTGPRRYSARTESAPDGSFLLTLPASHASIEVRAPGFATIQAQVDAGQPLLLRMERVGHVRGRVVSKADGTPVAGVPVHAWNWHTYDVRSPLDVSDAEGRFESDIGPGEGLVYAFGAGWVSAGLSQMTDRGVTPGLVKVGQGETAEVVVEVVPAGHVDGVVLQAMGEPLAGVTVGLELPERWRGFNPRWTPGGEGTAVTAADGRFGIGQLVPGFTYTAVTRPTAGIPGRSRSFTAASGETSHVEILIPDERWLTVRVIDKATGQPIAGVRVNATQRPRHAAGGETAADGTLRLGPLLPAPLQLHVRHADYLAPSGAGSGPYAQALQLPDPGPAPEVFVVELEAGGFLTGVVLGADGEPVTTGYLGVFQVGEPAGRSLGLCGLMQMRKPGAFRLGPVPTGSYDLVLVERAESLRHKQISRWTVRTGEPDLRLVVDPSLTEKDEDQILFRVLGPDGKPASGHARVYGPTRTFVNTEWVREGRLVVTGAAPGTVAWVEIGGPKDADGKPLGGVVHGPVKLEPGVHEIRLAAAPEIRGRVLGPDGGPVVGLLVQAVLVLPADVATVPSTFAVPAVRTDEAGRYTLAGGAAGTQLVLEVPARYALLPPVSVPPTGGDLEIRLVEGRTFEVLVRAEDGAPLAGAAVRASFLPTPPDRRATSDERGVARLSGLGAGTTYTLDVEPPQGRTDLAAETIDAWAAAATTVTLPAGRVVEGRVLRGTAPAGWASVWWKDRRGRWRRTQADNGGRFRFTAAAGGVVSIAAGPAAATRREAAGTALDVEPGANDVVLQLPP